MAKKYGVQTLAKALYSLDVYAYDINQLKNTYIREGKNADSLFDDLVYCYNLKCLVIKKMLKQRILIFQNSKKVKQKDTAYVFSYYRTKVGMPFIHPMMSLDAYASRYSYPVMYPDYFANTNTLAPFYSLKKSVKILTRYIRRSNNAIRYAELEIFNKYNTIKVDEDE